jgi:NAD(P)-dependent dehydrogenase (short-subunit alcohol dehydrogenase family)
MPSRSRIVLLTGAAGGIGRVMTRALLRGGHCVAAVDRDAASLERLKSLCDRTERLCPIVADLSTETGCAHAIEIARERFGTIEALVNNAGIGMSVIRPDAEVSHPGIEELTPAIWDRFFAIFVRAPVILTRLTLPLMREAMFGRIVNNTTSYRTMLRVLPYWLGQGSTRIHVSGMGERARRQPDHGECAGAGRTDRHANDLRSVGMAARKNAAARNHGTADRLAGFGCFGRLQRTAHHRSALGRLAASG